MAASRLTFHVVVAALLAQVAIACLPQDTRPTPASLLVTAASNDATQRGFDTDDGWHIEFTKVLVSLGRASFGDGSSSCTPYTDAGYQRVLDMRRPEEQKVNLIYGLGSCDLEFRVAYPTVEDSLAGAGVSDEDMLYMRTQGFDRLVTTGAGVDGYISGVAHKEAQSLTFSWSFRQNWSYKDCSVDVDGGTRSAIQMNGKTAESFNLTVHAEELFQNQNETNQWQLLFEPMVLADTKYGNGDGDVTLDELNCVYVRTMGSQSAFGDLGGLGAPDAGTTSGSVGSDNCAGYLSADTKDPGTVFPHYLEYQVYMFLYPSIFHYGDSGHCQATTSQNRRGG